MALDRVKSISSPVGTYGSERVKCYCEYNRLELDNHLPAVYKQIVFAGRTSHQSHRKENRGSLTAYQKLSIFDCAY